MAAPSPMIASLSWMPSRVGGLIFINANQPGEVLPFMMGLGPSPSALPGWIELRAVWRLRPSFEAIYCDNQRGERHVESFDTYCRISDGRQLRDSLVRSDCVRPATRLDATPDALDTEAIFVSAGLARFSELHSGRQCAADCCLGGAKTAATLDQHQFPPFEKQSSFLRKTSLRYSQKLPRDDVPSMGLNAKVAGVVLG